MEKNLVISQITIWPYGDWKSRKQSWTSLNIRDFFENKKQNKKYVRIAWAYIYIWGAKYHIRLQTNKPRTTCGVGGTRSCRADLTQSQPNTQQPSCAGMLLQKLCLATRISQAQAHQTHLTRPFIWHLLGRWIVRDLYIAKRSEWPWQTQRSNEPPSA